MLYKQNKSEKLSDELFKNPTSEYRGTPFWSWNCVLEKNELLRQIDCLKEMGFGGFHMHSRSGMGTKYLSPEFMELVKACTEKAEKEHMLAWLYDEDRWPSGTAGGIVTKNPEYRLKFIRLVKTHIPSVSKEEGNKTGKPYLIACYDIVLNSDGTLKSYNMISENDSAAGEKWYAYVCTPEPSGWHNNQTYIDTMSEEAVHEFIKITHETYKKTVGGKFGSTIPAIFTDEPNIGYKHTDADEEHFPWTYDFAETYKKTYGDDILPHLPEIRWELPDFRPSAARLRYHDHACERFTHAFSDQVGKWCSDNGIYFTGHVLEEPTLGSQTSALGEAMRTYRGFGIPGIDMLCNHIELSTAKQTQSAVHQYGREAMLSELYGVTGWQFDFRGHKFQGDWQAALGVTVRVPHLSWVTMKGCAKRDYPASINYQSSWYKEYGYVEDHFARINTALTRGKPCVRVGVIHPIESYWLKFSSNDVNSPLRADMEKNFTEIIERLLFSTIDFDFISESLIPSLNKETDKPKLCIGEMKYDAVIVPNLVTIRSTTLETLKKFKERGGKLIFVGECPTCVDGELSDEAKALFASSKCFTSASSSLSEYLSGVRDIKIYVNNALSSDLIYNMREDGDTKYLFIARAKNHGNADVYKKDSLEINISGEYKAEILDTLTGEIYDASYESRNGITKIYKDIYFSDSLLLRLTPGSASNLKNSENKKSPDYTIDIKSDVRYEREEDNVMVLDIAEYSENGTEYLPREEILRIDSSLRKKLGLTPANGYGLQAWAETDKSASAHPYLKFTFESKLAAECFLAFEEAEEVTLNGVNVPIEICGYYVDKQIHKIKLPNLNIGENTLIVRVPVGKTISIENMFILGDFDVETYGSVSRLIPKSNEISFGTITDKGMPFYGGNLTYSFDINTPDCDIRINASMYRGALMRVSVDGKDYGPLAYAPYEMDIENLTAGSHTVSIKLFATRANTFGSIHNSNRTMGWLGPNAWYTEGFEWAYEYQLKEVGILKSPVIEVYKKK